MSTLTVYSTAANDGFIESSQPAVYNTAREGGTLTTDTAATTAAVGQNFSTGYYFCDEMFLDFDTSSVEGTITAATLSLTPNTLYNTTEFTLEARLDDYGAALTDADYVAGSALSALSLYGTVASADLVAGTAEDIDLAVMETTAIPNYLRLILASERQRTGVTPTTAEYATLRSSDYAGTTSDPKLVLEYNDGPSVVTITAPVTGTTIAGGTINLTGTATDATPDTVRFHWDYSYQGGAWTACANSPSGYVASGASGTITFNLGTLADFGSVAFRCRAYDGTGYSPAYAQVVIAYSDSQTDITLLRSDGAVAVAVPISGCVIKRPLSAPAALTFTVDNFSANEAEIADDDDLVLYVNTHESGVYQFRGQVTHKTVGDVMEVEAQDIARTFDRLPVTRTLTGRKLGVLIKDIVENPTGDDPTGIIATADEFDDPLNPGNDLVVSVFTGEGRTVAQWLALARDWTGYEWYCEYSSGSWRFHWFNPAGNSAWAVAVRDDIGFEDESGTQAVVLSSPTKTVDRAQYANRITYWEQSPLPGLPTGVLTFDALYSETITLWETVTGYGAVTASTTQVSAGTYSIRNQRIYAAGSGSMISNLYLNAMHYDWGEYGFGALAFDVYLDATTDIGDGTHVAVHAYSGAYDGTADGSEPTRYLVPSGLEHTLYHAAESIDRRAGWVPIRYELSGFMDTNGFDQTDVRCIDIRLNPSTGAKTETVNFYIDNVRFEPRPGEPQYLWQEAKVETAAVTAGTEAALSVPADTRGLSFIASQSLALQYRDQRSTSRVTIGSVDIHGIRGTVGMESDVTTTLSSRGITAVDYPVAAIEYHLMDQGDLTRLTLGKREQDVLAGIQKLVQRVQQIDAGFRLV